MYAHPVHVRFIKVMWRGDIGSAYYTTKSNHTLCVMRTPEATREHLSASTLFAYFMAVEFH